MPVYASLFVALAAGSFVIAVVQRGAFFLFLWPALAFGVVSFGYAFLRPSVVGKRTDGTFHPGRRLALLPFFALSEGLWHLHSWFTHEDSYNEVAPKLWVGRWPGARALPDDVHMVVDVTAELPAHKTITGSKRYVCLPALDATVPDERAFRELVARLSSEAGGIFVHCAFGHGRSAMLAAALLIERGLARDADSAERLMRRSRPGIGLSGLQRSYVERFAQLRDRGVQSGGV